MRRCGLLFLLILAASLGVPPLALAAAPHATAGSTTSVCGVCHAPHQASTSRYLLAVEGTASVGAETDVCYTCHDGLSSATDVKRGPVNSFGSSAMRSGHAIEGRGVGADLTDSCSSCHSVHGDWESKPRLPKPLIETPGSTPATHAVSGIGASWCLACHTDAQDWYTSTTSTPYPATGAPVLVTGGYPALGAFPGRTVYEDPVRNGHSRIPTGTVDDPMVAGRTVIRGPGDCLWCHASHRSASEYDSLVATYAAPTSETVVADRTSGAYAALCFGCHSGGSWEVTGAADIARFTLLEPDSTDASETAGHRLKTAGGELPVDSPLPCFLCHGSHGSARGNQLLLADWRGASLEATINALDATTPAESVRRFCLGCHSTSDAVPRVWDSVAATYAVTIADPLLLGLRRDGTLLPGQTRPVGNTEDANLLRLVVLPSGDHDVSAIKSCYDCHGGDYSFGGSNVHRPRRTGIDTGVVSTPLLVPEPSIELRSTPTQEATATVP